MPQSAASGRSDEGDVTYSEVLKKAVGDDNGLSVASKASNDRAPPTYSKESNPKPRRSPQSTSQKGKKQHAGRYENGTALQQHSAYFDPDDDGIIWPWDTYNGCRKFGWGRVLSLIAAFLININLSYFTLPHWIPDLRFPIYIDRVHKNKHGSSSLSYDNLGHVREQMFDDFVARYDRGGKGGLDFWDLVGVVKGQRMVFDFFGLSATALEWLATYLLIWPEDGVMRMEDIRRVYDGTIFQHKADEYATKQKERKS